MQQVYHMKEAHQNYIQSIAVTPNNKYIVTGSSDKTVKIFDFQTKQLVHHYKTEHSGPVCAIVVTADSRYFITGCDDWSVRVFDIETRQLVQFFEKIHGRKQILIYEGVD